MLKQNNDRRYEQYVSRALNENDKRLQTEWLKHNKPKLIEWCEKTFTYTIDGKPMNRRNKRW
jgi:hypothetical protein